MHKRWTGWVLAVVMVAGGIAAQESPQPANVAAPASPIAPHESLAMFQLHPDVQIELAACEPQVVDPVAIRFDEDGRMWVVEMRDYPHGPAGGGKPQSRINILEDRDTDGFFETANVFADELLFATGLQPWRGGAFVTMAGRLAYLKDTDGDGRADATETWYTGFAEENSQLRANHPRLGLDNAIYVANGLRGGMVADARRPQQPPTSISNRDFRFDPLTREFAAVSGVGQFGLSFDFFGNRFVCSNRNPLQHVVLEDRYLRLSPATAISAVSFDVAKSGAASRVFPISRAWTTSNLHAGQFTAACGVHLYRGRQLPRAFGGNGFTCDPTGNLVHRELLQAAGATFVSVPDRPGIEFLASPDEWFRPVNLELGPGDELYVVDMYRAVIEHPQFMPDELKNRPDLLLGNDRGRIYRITAKNAPREFAVPSLSQASAAELIARLRPTDSSRGEWLRETAARLLFERQDATVGPALEQLLANADLPGVDAVARVRALWLLHGLGLLKQAHLRQALDDDSPRVREQAVVLAEPWLAQDENLRDRVRELASHEDARLRFQVALSLTPAISQADVAALTKIALTGAADEWTRQAVAIASASQAAAVATRILRQLPQDKSSAIENFVALLAGLVPQVAGAGVEPKREFLHALVAMPDRAEFARLQRLTLRMLAESQARQRSSLHELVDDASRPTVDRIFHQATAVVRDAQAPSSERADAAELLRFAKNGQESLIALALGERDQVVRLRAIAALTSTSDEEVWPRLIAGFASETPEVRGALLDALLARTSRVQLLLDEMDAGRIKPSEIDPARMGRLMRVGDAALRGRAEKILASAIPADRQQVLAEYQIVLTLPADAQRGRTIFQKNCANCHQIGEIGVNVAPDISDSRTKLATQLLTDILQPNRSIDGNYISYSAITTDGRVLTGVLAAETANSITLRQAEGKNVTLLRSELEELRSNGLSLMPEGLEKNIPPQEMADLLAFIKNWRYLDGRTPLGR
jgi:putative membrane-bound dehydrogenase-like protein